ncbi:MAG: hypothetical protein WC662_00095 [Candidatus Paceibacterota bacterium]|jgi:hypothetical protein
MKNKYEKIKNIIGYTCVSILILSFIIGIIIAQVDKPKEPSFSGFSNSACIKVCEAIGWDDSKWSDYVSKVNGGMNGIDDMCESFSCSENRPTYAPTTNSSQGSTFYGYDCKGDCSGHKAGYEWASDKNITDYNNCGGNSQSFIEGCQAYVSGENNFGNNE